MLTNLSELVDPEILVRERNQLLDDAADLRWAASYLAERGSDPANIMTLFAAADIAERRASSIPVG